MDVLHYVIVPFECSSVSQDRTGGDTSAHSSLQATSLLLPPGTDAKEQKTIKCGARKLCSGWMYGILNSSLPLWLSCYDTKDRCASIVENLLSSLRRTTGHLPRSAFSRYSFKLDHSLVLV